MNDRRVGRVVEGRRAWWIVGLAAFLLLDAALIWWAVSAGRGAEVDAEPLPLSAFAPAPTPRPATAAARPTPTPTPTPTLEPIVLEPFARRIVPLDAAQAWRVAGMGCGGPTAIEWSEDGGASWTAWSTGEDVWGIREIVGFNGDPSTVGIIASLAGDCRPEYRISFTGGEFWASYPDEQPDTIVIDPADPSVLLAAGAGVGSPCGAVSEFAVSATGVGVLCTSTELRIAPADLSAWVPVSVVGSAVAITNAGDGYLAAARRDPACSGVRLSLVGADASVAAGACLPGEVDAAQPVALATAVDGAIWLWVGERVGVSNDGGTTWTGI